MLQVGTKLLYIGGSDGTTAQSTVYVARTVGNGNFDTWADGPALPEPRADASVAYVAGRIFVIGGTDDAGAPTSTVLRPHARMPSPASSANGTRRTTSLTLPEPRTAAAAAVTTDGLLLDRRPQRRRTGCDDLEVAARRAGRRWASGPPRRPLSAPQADATAVVVGDYLWLYGGSDANGPVGAVQRGVFGQPAAEGLPDNPDEGKVIRWDVNNAANLPVARTQRRRRGAPTARSTWPAATTAAVRSARSTGRSPTRPAT